MNKLVVLIIVLAGAIAFVLAGVAQETGPQVRVVNLGALGSTSPTDDELADLATMDMSENPRLFAPADEFVVTIEPCPTGTPDGEAGNFLLTSDFVTIDAMTKEVFPYHFSAVGADAKVGTYSVVVVKKDESVARFLAVTGASESDTSLKTEACLTIAPSDTILTFVDTAGTLVPPQETTGTENLGAESTGAEGTGTESTEP